MTNELPEIVAQSDEGLCDFMFAIVQHRRLPSGVFALHVGGTHLGQRVGFEMRIGSEWLALPLGTSGPFTMERGTVTWHSTGGDSNALLSVLYQLFETARQPPIMKQAVAFVALCLAGDPRDLASAPVDFKLVHESDDAGRRVEIYAHIDLPAGQLHLGEKDPGYRAAIVSFLDGR